MLDLAFTVEGAEAVPHAVAPQLALGLRIVQSGADPVEVQNLLLHTQLRIEPLGRLYDEASTAGLAELFGPRERWGRTMRSLLWTHVDLVVPPFREEVRISLPVPCSFDFNVAATKYFHALGDGEVTLSLLFSGSVFFRTEAGALQVAPLPWTQEARYDLPVRVWREMMELYYPQCAWLVLRRDVVDELSRFKISQGCPTWEQALERLLQASGRAGGSP